MASTRRRRITRAIALAATSGLAVLTLSGCLSLTANLTVDSDAKATGDLALGLQKQAAGMLGMSDLATFEEGLQSEELTGDGGGVFESGQCTASETDTEFLYTCTFTDTAFATSEDGPWTITKDGDVITFRLVNEGSGGTDDPAADMLGSSMGDMTVNVTFPGPIQSITGDGATKNSDTTATVKVPLSDPADITITSAASSGGGIGTILLIVGLALLAIIVIGIIVALVLRGRKSSASSAAIAAPMAGAGAAAGASAMAMGAADAPTQTIALEAAETTVVETADGTVVDETVVEETVVDETVVESPAEDTPADGPKDDPAAQ